MVRSGSCRLEKTRLNAASTLHIGTVPSIDKDFEKALRLHENGELEKVTALVEKLILEYPNDDRPFQKRAFLLQARGLFIEAALDLDRAIILNPNEPNNFLSSALGQLHMETGNG